MPAMKRGRNALARFSAVSGRVACLLAMAMFLALPFLHRHEHARHAAIGAVACEPALHGCGAPGPAVSAAGTECRADFCDGGRHNFHADCAVCKALSFSFLSLFAQAFSRSYSRPEIIPAAFPPSPAVFDRYPPCARAPPAGSLPA